MPAVFRRSTTEVKRFSELFLAEEFSLSQTQPGPYIKVSPTTYAFEVFDPLLINNNLIRVAVPNQIGQYRYGFKPAQSINPKTIIYSAHSPLPPQYFYGSGPDPGGSGAWDDVIIV